MGRKPIDLNPEMGKRLSSWLKEVNMTQTELAGKIHYTQQYLSTVINGKKNLTADLAAAISTVAVKPLYNPDGIQIGYDQVRPSYLLCEDDIKTKNDFSRQYVNFNDAVNDSCRVLLESSLREVCLRENIPIPTLGNIPELLLLTAQIKDFSDSLMWNYVKWKHNSHVWSLLEQAEEVRKRRENDG